MHSFYLSCFIAILGIASVACQEECGRRTCRSGQCCVRFRSLSFCGPYRKENRLCGYSLLCPCETGLECTNEGLLSKCKRIASSTEEITTESITEITSEATTLSTEPPEGSSQTVSTEEATAAV